MAYAICPSHSFHRSEVRLSSYVALTLSHLKITPSSAIPQKRGIGLRVAHLCLPLRLPCLPPCFFPNRPPTTLVRPCRTSSSACLRLSAPLSTWTTRCRIARSTTPSPRCTCRRRPPWSPEVPSNPPFPSLSSFLLYYTSVPQHCGLLVLSVGCCQ